MRSKNKLFNDENFKIFQPNPDIINEIRIKTGEQEGS